MSLFNVGQTASRTHKSCLLLHIVVKTLLNDEIPRLHKPWHQAVPQKNIKLESNCQAMQASASKLRGFIIKTLKRQTRFSAEGIPHELDHFTEVTSCEIFGEHWLLYPSQLTWLKGPAHHSPRTRGLRCAVKPWITQSCFLTPNSKQMKTYSRKSFLSD